MDLDRLGERAVENAMKINRCKGKAVSCKRARLKDPPGGHQIAVNE
jgi:hypothetical protein